MSAMPIPRQPDPSDSPGAERWPETRRLRCGDEINAARAELYTTLRSLGCAGTSGSPRIEQAALLQLVHDALRTYAQRVQAARSGRAGDAPD